MAEFGMMVDAMWEPAVLSRLNEAAALPEEVRRKAVERIVEYSINDLDPAWADSSLAGLLTAQERADLHRRVEEDVLPELEQRIDTHVDSIISDLTKEQLYQTPRDYVAAIRSAFPESPDVLALCDRAEEHINNRAFSDEDEDELPAQSSGLAAPARPASSEISSQRDPFEDVAAGH